MENTRKLSDILSEFLERDINEVKNILTTMSLRDLVNVVNAIDDGDKESAFKIYSGYTV